MAKQSSEVWKMRGSTTPFSQDEAAEEPAHFALSYSVHLPESSTTLAHSRSVQEQLDSDIIPHAESQDVQIHLDEMEALEKQHQIISPPLPVFLKFENVVYAVHPKDPATARKAKVGSSSSKKQILNGITGSVAPGEILAMMGPSGSGKTTLLNILGGRLTSRNVTGSLTYNSIPYCPALKRRIGFVTQDDVLFPHLTVKETLVFAALLRLPACMTRSQKFERAQTVLRELSLERCQDTIVGGAWRRGVSGGERKRTSIGFEILVDPSLLLLDEPTSGLDSTTALKLLQVLERNAAAGRSIVTTIHQPSSRMFHMFDKLILLSQGHTLYTGPAKEAMRYFDSLGFAPQLAMNPADFLLDLATGVAPNVSLPAHLKESGSQPDEDLQQEILMYLQSKYKTELEPRVKEKFLQLPLISPDQAAAIRERKQWTSSWWQQFVILGNRTFKERYTGYFSALRLFQTVGVAILLGFLWWNSKLNTGEEIQDQVGLMFYIVMYWSSFAIFTSVSTFPLERHLLVKERAADMYRLSAYFVSSSICDFLCELVYPTTFISIIYFMVDLHKTARAFIFTILSVYLVNAVGQGVGYFLGAAVMDLKNSSILASIILLVMMLTGGYYVQHIPVFISWLKYLSFIFYSFHLLVKVQFSSSQSYNCSGNGGCRSIQQAAPFRHIGLKGGFLQVWVLLGMAASYRFLAYLYLRKLKPSV